MNIIKFFILCFFVVFSNLSYGEELENVFYQEQDLLTRESHTIHILSNKKQSIKKYSENEGLTFSFLGETYIGRIRHVEYDSDEKVYIEGISGDCGEYTLINISDGIEYPISITVYTGNIDEDGNLIESKKIDRVLPYQF